MRAAIKIFSALTAHLSSDSDKGEKRCANLSVNLVLRLLCTFLVADLSSPACSRADVAGFEYGSIYSPSCTETFQKANGVGNVDYDWGLWGHNLQKVLGTNLADEVFAFDGKKRDHSQYCFSSEQLYRRLVDFILSEYGDGNRSPSRFAIMPNDNSLVCQCTLCRNAGNTPTSATPAVSKLVARLARRFPHHMFFLSSYLSAKEPPEEKMPQNVGVIISAMELPYTSRLEEKTVTGTFGRLLDRWRKTVRKIYVWDYMRNFDDYLSPYPCLGILRKRFLWYLSQGVSGVILNGSGNDYAAFDDMQTAVLANLIKNPASDIATLVRRFYAEGYPVSGKSIADYYLSLEDSAMLAGSGIPYYGGIGDEVSSYLNPSAFLVFDGQLDKMSKHITGDERRRLNSLLTGFNYTHLELIRAGVVIYDEETVASCLTDLEGAKMLKNMNVYREAHGLLSDYIGYYRLYPPKRHRPDGLACDVAALTDGLKGSAYDYHTNWVVSGQPLTTYVVDVKGRRTTLTVGCLQAPAWHIYAPARLEIWQNGERKAVVGEASGSTTRGEDSFCRLSYVLPLSGIEPGQIKLLIIAPQKEGRVTVACDEIE